MSARRSSAVWLLLVSAGACERVVAVGHEDAPVVAGGGAGAGGSVGEGGAPGGSAGEAGQSGAGAAGSAGQGGSGGAPPELVPWSAEHELGNLDEWVADGAGIHFVEGGGSVEITSELAHTGEGALVATIDPQDNVLSQAVVGRELRLREGRYGAWYYLPETPTADYWVLMKLSHGRDENRFDIDVEAPADAEPRLRLYEHGQDWITDPAPVSVPIGQWFHVEALYRSTPDGDGRLMVLQDGAVVLDTGPRPTADSDLVAWFVGSVSWWIVPSPYRIFIDDATIDAGFGL